MKPNKQEEKIKTNHSTAYGTASARFDGISEPNNKLRGHAGALVYDKMRRTDPTIKSILSVITSPLKGAQWTIRSQANDEDKKRQQMAEMFYAYFWERANTLFSEFLSNALTMLPFGFAVFEKVWTTAEINGQLLQVLDLQFRPQVSIDEIDVTKRIVKQTTPEGTAELSFDDLLFFVYDKEGNDYWGNSILRPCYHAYEMKKEQYEFWGVAGARQATGFLDAAVPETMQKDSEEYRDLEQGGRDIASNRSQMFIHPEGVLLKYVVPSVNADFYRTTINNLDMDIRNAALANFIGLGTANTGSYAVGDVQYKLFMQALCAISNSIEQVFTAQVLKPMTDVNFGAQEFYPELVCQDLDRDTVVSKLQLALQFIGMGVIKPTDKDESDIRYKLGLGEKLDDEGAEQKPKKPIPPTQEDEENPDNEDEDNNKEPGKEKAAKTQTWEALVHNYQKELYRAMRANLGVMTDKAIADTRRHLDKKGLNGLVDDLSISTNLYQTVLIKKLSYLAVQGWNTGKALAEKAGLKAAKSQDNDGELEDAELSSVPKPLRGPVKNRAKMLVEKHATGLKNVILNVSNKPNNGFNLDTIIAEVGKQVDEYLSRAALNVDAENAVISTMDDGEQTFYKEEVSDEIAYFTYKLGAAEKHTELCLWLKDHTFTPWGTAFYMVAPPNHHRCTGRMVPTFKRPGLPAPDPATHDQVPPPSLMEMKQF